VAVVWLEMSVNHVSVTKNSDIALLLTKSMMLSALLLSERVFQHKHKNLEETELTRLLLASFLSYSIRSTHEA
jgi:hypothetical protein